MFLYYQIINFYCKLSEFFNQIGVQGHDTLVRRCSKRNGGEFTACTTDCMAGKAVKITAHCDLCDYHLESLIRWLSCNGEIWGVGPTAVFASAAALFLYNELEATILVAGHHAPVSSLEKTLISTMVLGMLALMIHLWVCSMRFFQYYLDTLIRDSPSILLEMTTAGLLGSKAEGMALGPLTNFLKQQQPQIHMTMCWFLSLCYADYVRKHYCARFNIPYLEQWQMELQERATRSVHRTVQQMNSFVGSVHRRLRGYTQPADNRDDRTRTNRVDTGSPTPKRTSSVELTGTASKASWGQSTRERVSDCALPTRKQNRELNLRLCQSNEATADAIEKLRTYIAIIEWAKCGESGVSVLPTAVWAAGAAAVAHRLLSALFRRFMFRRVAPWELLLQNLLFVWTVVYSLHFWLVFVRILKIMVDFFYDDDGRAQQSEEMEGRKLMQQWLIWMCSMAPLAFYMHIRPRPQTPPLMIWITTSPWQRREMGAYGYYLSRPLSTLHSTAGAPGPQRILPLRRAFSDSKLIIKEPPKKKRYSKSV